ncbi:hypothetical protein FNW52_12605 [Flavobacterium sp. ZT3R18]|uniref:DUF6602 domain-containing protein n=1 Tax=Flavobacterium sp. ZT3R18 TaxID=2594429 RepID=UPI001179C399|nr:DUF6602 domain-containing protein [Flavobacterium sp. ZT3R18]TRX34976.1 hypothetical protein FNW52_12605 [Flavobacterium sp. ZT3R18]
MNNRQIELVEFSEKIYHSGLRHTGMNGSLYEDIFIQFLREDLPQFAFFKGQIVHENITSLQYDIMICKKETPHEEFLRKVNPYVNIVNRKNCLGVIELKKWSFPKMILSDGVIQNSYTSFKNSFPELKYFFVSLRFKDRKNDLQKTWINLKTQLNTDGNFCFFGRTEPKDEEWLFPWRTEIINKHEAYFGEYENLIQTISDIV